MIIGEADEDEDAAMEDDVAGVAYRETMTSADGFTRGPNGRVRFNKDTKKRRREDDDAEDVEMMDLDGSAGRKPEKKRPQPKLGHEFKAKVSCLTILRWLQIELGALCRKLEVMLRKAVSTHTPTCPSPKQPKRRAVASASVLRTRDNTFFSEPFLRYGTVVIDAEMHTFAFWVCSLLSS